MHTLPLGEALDPIARAVPFVLCPECGATEPHGGFGSRSGALILTPARYYRDSSGFLYCRACGAVWNGLHTLRTEDPLPAAEPSTSQRLGISPGFDARDADDRLRFIELARLESKQRGASTGRAANARFRVNDAATMCETLGLSNDMREAVLYHVALLSMKADLRKLAASRLRPRAEAFTIATVALVCERFHVPCDVALLLESVSFTKGPRRITTTEYRTAYAGAYSWLAANVWRAKRRTTR